MSLTKLIEAVEAGEYDREAGPKKYLKFLDDCDDAGCKVHPTDLLVALHRGKEHAAAILRALEQEGRNG